MQDQKKRNSNALPPSTPGPYAPEKEAEEEQSADVHAEGVAEFISETGIIAGIDGNVVAHEQVWHGHGHQCALEQAALEARRLMAALQRDGNPVQGPPNHGCDEQKCRDLPRNVPPSSRGGFFRGVFFLSNSSSFRRGRACFCATASRKQNISIPKARSPT